MLLKICVSGAKTLVKISKNSFEMQDFFQKWKWGIWRWKRACKGGFPELKFRLKKLFRAAHPGTTFQCECPPSPPEQSPACDFVLNQMCLIYKPYPHEDWKSKKIHIPWVTTPATSLPSGALDVCKPNSLSMSTLMAAKPHALISINTCPASMSGNEAWELKEKLIEYQWNLRPRY